MGLKESLQRHKSPQTPDFLVVPEENQLDESWQEFIVSQLVFAMKNFDSKGKAPSYKGLYRIEDGQASYETVAERIVVGEITDKLLLHRKRFDTDNTQPSPHRFHTPELTGRQQNNSSRHLSPQEQKVRADEIKARRKFTLSSV